MLVVTGNIGCGKSTVVKMLVERMPTWDLFDFDRAVHLMYDDPVVRADLYQEFGTSDRRVISDLVFGDKSGKLMEQLYAITNPHLNGLVRNAFAAPHTILDIPLYFEYFNLAYQHVDKIVLCVSCSPEIQQNRIKMRNGFDDEKIDNIIASQLKVEYKEEHSDHVIRNDGSLEDLERNVDLFVARYFT